VRKWTIEVASAALPRITEIIFAFPAEHRAGAFEVAECRYRQAARDFGCAEAGSEYLVAVMRKLRTLMEQGGRANTIALPTAIKRTVQRHAHSSRTT
jgi:hypothetical protein